MSDANPKQRQEELVDGDSAQSARARSEAGRSVADAPESDTTQTFAYVFSSPPPEGPEDDADDSEPTVISKQAPIAPVASWAALTPRELGQLLLGSKLDHFQLDEFIGGGGMGAVFRARDTLLGRTVAVKVLAAGAAGSEENRVRFQNEAQSAARLDHPNIARVHYVGEAEGFKYIVFEYLEGRNLRDLVAEAGPLPLADALNFTLQIAEALAHAWQRDIVHRDIKPSNVLATPEGQVKLVDMGLARLKDVAARVEDVTASGVTLGTFDYISPEQARDPRTADIRSDIYSLGCTLYFMLCGRPPFQGGTAVQKLLMHQADEPPNPRDIRPDLPQSVEQFLRRMLAKSPDERFQNPAELIAAVTTLAAELGIALHPTTTVRLTVAEQSSTWLASSLPWVVPTVLLLLCVFILDYFDRRLETPPPSWPRQRQVAESAEDAPRTPTGQSENAAADDATRSRQGTAPGAAGQSSGRAEASRPQNGGPPTPGEPLGETLDTSISGNATGALDDPGENPNPFASIMASLTDLRSKAAELLEQIPLVAPGGSHSVSPAEAGAAPAPPSGGIWNVTRQTSHLTVADAIGAARHDDVIEIREDGVTRLERSSLPIRVQQKSITLRSDRGVWPVLQVLTSAEPGGSDGVLAVFRVDDGSISIEGVELELSPGTMFEAPVTGWKLFQLGVGGSVELANCWMTFHGSAGTEYNVRRHDDFFHVIGPAPPFTDRDANATPKEVRIDLQNVVARGGDTFVSVEGDTHLFFSMQNGLVATRGYLFDGSYRDAMDRGQIDVQLDHVTAHLGRGGLRVHGVARSEDLQVGVRNSILLGGARGSMVEHLVDDGIASTKLPLVWEGRRNIYGSWGFTFQRQVQNGAGSIMDFGRWTGYWNATVPGDEIQSMSLPSIPWALAREDDELPLAARTPADYAVDAADPQMQTFLTSGGTLPGVIAEEFSRGSEEATAATTTVDATRSAVEHVPAESAPAAGSQNDGAVTIQD